MGRSLHVYGREPGYLSGDVNDDGGVNIADITVMVDYLFLGGAEPPIMEACDANGDCNMANVADLTYMAAYLFQGGGEPQMHCSMVSKQAARNDRLEIGSAFENNRTIVSVYSDVDLRGLQLELSGDAADAAVNLLSDRVELFQGSRDGTIRIGLLDIEGSEVISAGEHQVIELPGRHEVVSATGSDIDHHSIPAALVGESPVLPRGYRLDQNYPNPFNPSTSIDFELAHSNNVSLTVYNIAGQRVATLLDGPLEAGAHTVMFDAGALSSGIYLYRLMAGEYSATRKMLLLK